MNNKLVTLGDFLEGIYNDLYNIHIDCATESERKRKVLYGLLFYFLEAYDEAAKETPSYSYIHHTLTWMIQNLNTQFGREFAEDVKRAIARADEQNLNNLFSRKKE